MKITQVRIERTASYEPNPGELTGLVTLQGAEQATSTIKLPPNLLTSLLLLIEKDKKVKAIISAHELEEASDQC